MHVADVCCVAVRVNETDTFADDEGDGENFFDFEDISGEFSDHITEICTDHTCGCRSWPASDQWWLCRDLRHLHRPIRTVGSLQLAGSVDCLIVPASSDSTFLRELGSGAQMPWLLPGVQQSWTISWLQKQDCRACLYLGSHAPSKCISIKAGGYRLLNCLVTVQRVMQCATSIDCNTGTNAPFV